MQGVRARWVAMPRGPLAVAALSACRATIVRLSCCCRVAAAQVPRKCPNVPLADGVEFELSAAFTLAYGTSHHAVVDRGALQAGETMLVLGAAGGVGLAAVEIGKALGARVIAAASSDAKLATCVAHGADAT